MTVYLVCEGSASGLDERVLDALVVQHHKLSIWMASAGGRRGHGSVRDYISNRSSIDVAISVEDRDYRPKATASATWSIRSGKRFIWHRHEIENYLLHPRVVLELFDGFRSLTSSTSSTWASSLPVTESDVSALLQSLARPLLETHAAEVLIEELRQKISDKGSVHFSLPRPSRLAGSHMVGQNQWLTALNQEANRLRQICNDVAKLPEFESTAIDSRYGSLLAQFQDPGFLASGDYLIDLAGKELLSALCDHLNGPGVPSGLNQKFVADELLRHLARIYQPNVLYNPDDFAELAKILATF